MTRTFSFDWFVMVEVSFGGGRGGLVGLKGVFSGIQSIRSSPYHRRAEVRAVGI